jgi:hypothetical protein
MTYKEHYALSRESFNSQGARKYESLYDLTVDDSILGDLDLNLISEIHKKFCYKVNNNIGCYEDTHAIRINEWKDIKEIKTLANSFMPILEEQVFGCHAAIEYLHPYRNTTREASIKNEWDTNELESSWKWHYDDCPREFLKFFIYLNEVTENSGCLKYLTDKNGEVPVLESFRIAPGHHARPQIYTGSRIPSEVIQEKIEEEGWKVKNVVGPAGAYVVHTPNIYHRASCPSLDSEPRDVLFFFIRPKLTKQNPYINEDTKSFQLNKKTLNCKQYDLN